MSTYQALAALIFGVIFSFYFGFKSRQAAGAARLNKIESEFGGGSFFDSVKSGFMELFWGVLCLGSILVAVVGFSTFSENDKKPKKTEAVQTSPVTPEVTKQAPEKIEQQKLPDAGSSEKQYDGDDPIIRARLGLPPKDKSE
jgi:hypothetical protein